jgi:AcrR family transcriptional regulator
MANKRPDRRIGRTRRALKEALTALVLEKGYDSLTVEELTQRADLSRTTFYLHYRDKEQLLLESVDVMVNDLIRQITQLPVTARRLP